MRNEALRLSRIIDEQDKKIEKLSEVVGEIEDYLAEKGVFVGEYKDFEDEPEED